MVANYLQSHSIIIFTHAAAGATGGFEVTNVSVAHIKGSEDSDGE